MPMAGSTSFKEDFNTKGAGQFGSGWAWVIKDSSGALKVVSTPNQDNPLMDDAKEKGTPILGNDVWGTRLLSDVQERSSRVSQGLVGHRELGRGRQALRRGVGAYSLSRREREGATAGRGRVRAHHFYPSSSTPGNSTSLPMGESIQPSGGTSVTASPSRFRPCFISIGTFAMANSSVMTTQPGNL